MQASEHAEGRKLQKRTTTESTHTSAVNISKFGHHRTGCHYEYLLFASSWFLSLPCRFISLSLESWKQVKTGSQGGLEAAKKSSVDFYSLDD